MQKENDVVNAAFSNYSISKPWPENDPWHMKTCELLNNTVQKWLNNRKNGSEIILCAGAGTAKYDTPIKIIYMDIIEEYVNQFPNFVVGSIEKIPLPDNSINGIICVGSVLNYVDAQKALSEFKRILTPGGELILEFERANSAEFLFKHINRKTLFMNKYHYNNQVHLLWMYNEKYILHLLKFYSFKINKKLRYHCISTLLYRFGMSENNASKYIVMDKYVGPLSYITAHNIVMTVKLSPELYY